MKHTNTRSLYEYWNKQRGENRAALRSDIRPADVKWLLPSMFILEQQTKTNFPFTLAGTHLCDHYAMELRGLNMCNFWHGQERTSITHILQSVLEENAVGIIGFNAHTNLKNITKMEMVVMPLHAPTKESLRILGCISPFGRPVWAGKESEKITHHEISSLRMITPGQDSYSQLQFNPAQDVLETAEISGSEFTAVKHLRVIDGGKQR